jgi:hypothetical protein
MRTTRPSPIASNQGRQQLVGSFEGDRAASEVADRVVFSHVATS